LCSTIIVTKRRCAIAKAMGLATKDLVLPVKKLIAVGAISSRGQKRSTQYFPGD
jgi:hypothetical protein